MDHEYKHRTGGSGIRGGDLFILFDTDAALCREFGIWGYPTSVILDADMNVVLNQAGHLSNEVLTEYIENAKSLTGETGKMTENPAADDGALKEEESAEGLEEIYFARGCFWGVESYFSQVPGVARTSVGYALKDARYIPSSVEDMAEAMSDLEKYMNTEDDLN